MIATPFVPAETGESSKGSREEAFFIQWDVAMKGGVDGVILALIVLVYRGIDQRALLEGNFCGLR